MNLLAVLCEKSASFVISREQFRKLNKRLALASDWPDNAMTSSAASVIAEHLLLERRTDTDTHVALPL